jgi:alpha-glucosidase
MFKFFLVSFLTSAVLSNAHATHDSTLLSSPDKHIQVTIKTGEHISYNVRYKNKRILPDNTISLSLDDGRVLGHRNRMISRKSRSIDKNVVPLYGMADHYRDWYNEVEIQFEKRFSIIFRAYNNGVAYRFSTRLPGKINIMQEETTFRLPPDTHGWMQKVGGFLNSYEEHYLDAAIAALDSGKLAVLPLLVETNGIKIAFTEADLFDYPGLYLTYSKGEGLQGVHPPVALRDSVGGCCPNFEKVVTQTAPYIAQTNGTRTFPWRLMIVAEEDKDLLYNNLVYLLASDHRSENSFSWVKPGKVVWDWWFANNLKGVSFNAGLNTETYKHYIDFAAENKIAYINMDEGWSDQHNLLSVNHSSLDMAYLFDYASRKGVGIILWCVWHTLDRQMQESFDQFEKWGVKGLKVDFMDRDDQYVVNFYERIATEAAKRKMFINFHGAFKPTGMERTYPNVINREAVMGLEYNKFSDRSTPDHAVDIAFIRMLAGPLDYTPGGMTNASREDFRISKNRPMTQGTRCHQLAMFALYYSPLQMLSDSPEEYRKDPAILQYIASVPTVWDETVPIAGIMGEYAVIARRKGDTWFLSGVTNWTGRTIQIPLTFLRNGNFQVTLFTDGKNASRIGDDYVCEIQMMHAGERIAITMAAGGGFALTLKPK